MAVAGRAAECGRGLLSGAQGVRATVSGGQLYSLTPWGPQPRDSTWTGSERERGHPRGAQRARCGATAEGHAPRNTL